MEREQELRRSEQGLRTRVDEVIRVVIRNHGGNQGGGGGPRDRNISEYKAVLNLRVLTDDRAGRKEWRAKFINVMSQVRPGVRDLLRAMESHRDEVFTEQDFDIFMQDDRYRDRYEDWSQDLWWVLVEKTAGGALLRVKGVTMGNGMEAFRRLHRWFGKQRDLGLAELRQKVLRPMQAKREEDTARCIEEWQESIMDLRRVDPDYIELPDAYQTAALRGILTGKYRDHIDMKMAEKGIRKK